MVEENSRKSLCKTLLINSPFDWKYLLSNKWRKPLNRVGKLAQNPLRNLIENSPQMPQFIEFQKLAVGARNELSVDRPVDRPTVRILTVEPSVDRSVDLARIQRAVLSVRSTSRSTRPF